MPGIHNGIGTTFRRSAFGGTPSGTDPNADAFIAAWESATSDTLGATQKAVINEFVLMLKGNGTTNSSDIWTLLTGTSSVILPYIPKDDSIAYYDGYALDLMSATSVVTWANFTAGDITPSYLKGGALSGKYGIVSVQPSDFDQNSFAATFYARTFTSSNNRAYGTTTNFGASDNTFNLMPFRVNQTSNSNGSAIPATPSVVTNRRIASASVQQFVNGVEVSSQSSSSSTPNALDFYIHAINNGGSPTLYNGDEFAGFAFTVGMTNDEIKDFYEAIQYLNDNIITGGR